MLRRASAALCLMCAAAGCAAPGQAPAAEPHTTGAESAAGQGDAGADAGPSFIERERRRMAREADERDRERRRDEFMQRNRR